MADKISASQVAVIKSTLKKLNGTHIHPDLKSQLEEVRPYLDQYIKAPLEAILAHGNGEIGLNDLNKWKV